jgi:hypothetical protein
MTRSFAHEDGRRIELQIDGTVLLTSIFVPDDPEPVTRRAPHANSKLADETLAARVAELLADGFREVTAAAPVRDRIDELAAVWREEDPSFDIDSLTAPLRASEEGTRIVESVFELDVVWVKLPDGTSRGDNERTEARRASAKRVLRAETSLVDHALMLALRARDCMFSTELNELFITRRGVPDHLAAFGSCVAAVPKANDRPGVVADVLREWQRRKDPAYDDAAIVSRFLPLLSAPRWETASAAAKILVPHTNEPGVFDAIWATRTRSGDVFEYSIMEACELRRDPATLPWLEQLSRKRRGYGWRDRVEQAMSTVRGSR